MRPWWTEGLAGHGRIIEQLLADDVADQLVVRQLVDEVVAIGEVLDPADAVGDDDALEPLVGLRVLDDAEERREAGAGAEQEQGAAGRRLSITSVPVGLRPTSTSSPSFRCCRREVSGPSGTLIEKNSSASS